MADMDNETRETTAMTDEVKDGELMPQAIPGTGLVRRAARDVALMPVMDLKLAKQRLNELQDFCGSYLQESHDGGNDGGDYGIIPGAGKKKNLLKSGADKLCDVYGLADRYVILSKIENFDTGLFDYSIQCELYRKTDEMFVGSGLGSCSSRESKYWWRQAQRECPQCGKEAIIKGKVEYGGGWVCFKKKGGCGATFGDNDPEIIDQKVGRVINEDVADQKNTVLKMAKKRAKIDAVIGVTRSSGLFTQDLDEHRDADVDEPKTATTTTNTAKPADQQPQKEESQAERIARIKAEQAAKQQSEQKSEPDPKATKAAETPKPTSVTKPVNGTSTPSAEPSNVAVIPEGFTLIRGINVKNGPEIVKDGVKKPSWGPMFIISWTAKIKASDGVMVVDATTFDEKICGEAETARETKTPVKPVVVPGSKKGSYTITGFER